LAAARQGPAIRCPCPSGRCTEIARGVPGIISVGNREEWPRELWGSQDWTDEEAFLAAREQERRTREEAARAVLGKELRNDVVLPPPGPRVAAGFSLFAKPRPRGRERMSAQSRAVDRLLAKHLGGASARSVCKRRGPQENRHWMRIVVRPPPRKVRAPGYRARNAWEGCWFFGGDARRSTHTCSFPPKPRSSRI
jgi:hypothetical protein